MIGDLSSHAFFAGHDPCDERAEVHQPVGSHDAVQHAGWSVLLIGGFAMRPKHLSKYRVLYQQQGVDRVEMMTPSILSMTVPRLADRIARQVLQRLEAQPGPMILHVFSGAVWIYFALNEFASEAVRKRIRAVVFESTPLDVKPEQFGRFLAWQLRRRYQPSWSYPFILYRWLVGISPSWERRNLRNMMALPPGLNVLFIYSQSDVVADARYIEQYREALQGHLDVTTLSLRASRHCQAIRDESEAYHRTIYRFVNRLLHCERD